MNVELIRYRCSPSAGNLKILASAVRPWLWRQGARILSGYRDLNLDSDGEDLVNEGLLSMTSACRRFVHQCPWCRETFLRGARLSDHIRGVHRRRGVPDSLVTLPTFARLSAKLAMQRTAFRLIPKELPSEQQVVEEVDADWESRVAMNILIRNVSERVSDRWKSILADCLDGHAVSTPARFKADMSKMLELGR